MGHNYIKRMARKLFNYHFFGENAILVIDFQARFVREAKIQEMFEAQALATLPSFFRGSANSQYDAGAKMEFPQKIAFLVVRRPYNISSGTMPSRQGSATHSPISVLCLKGLWKR